MLYKIHISIGGDNKTRKVCFRFLSPKTVKKNEKNHTYKFANNSEFDFLCSVFTGGVYIKKLIKFI